MGRVTSTPAVGIIADDLTGAGDSAVQFARKGWRARLSLSEQIAGSSADGAVVATVTDARAMSPARARSTTRAAVESLRRAGVNRIFLKIDSTLRGSVGAQIAGALAAGVDDAIAVVCPAYPAMGRVVDNGRLLVNGAGVETTSVGRDPVTPVTTSSLSELIPGSVGLRIVRGDAIVLAASILEAGSRIVHVDATTDDDLSVVADAIVLLGVRAIPVGSAGLAEVMAGAWGTGLPDTAMTDAHTTRPGPVLVQVSSLHDVSRMQFDRLLASAAPDTVRALAPPFDDVVGADVALDWVTRTLEVDPALPDIVVVLAPLHRGTVTSSAASGRVDRTAADLVADGLAAISAHVIDRAGARALVLMGGEGARALLRRSGAASILIAGSLREGLPIGVIDGGHLDGLTVVTKAGGFGSESTLSDILPELLDPQSRSLREPARPQGDNS